MNIESMIVDRTLHKVILEATPISLRFLDKTQLDQWVKIGRDLSLTGQSVTWWLADWAAYGEREYGQLKQFCETNAMNYGTVRNLAWVAASVDCHVRRDNLSFGHHVEVASLPAREQKKWLALAVKEKLSVVELRRRIRESTMIHPPEKTFGPSDEGIEVSKIFLDASVILERKSEFVKSNPDEVWDYASPFLKKAAALWPDRIQVKGAK